MYHGSRWYSFDSQGGYGYSPAWNLNNRCQDYTLHGSRFTGDWGWRDHRARNRNWYRVPDTAYGNAFAYGDNHRHESQPGQNRYPIPNSGLSYPLPYSWRYGDVHPPRNVPRAGYPDHTNAERGFRPSINNHPGQTIQKPSPAPGPSTHFENHRPGSSAATEPVSVPRPEAASAEGRIKGQTNDLRESVVDNFNESRGSPTSPALRNTSLCTQPTLQKYIQELKRERALLRRERQSFHQLNSQFRSLLCSLKTELSQRCGVGCRCRAGKRKGNNVEDEHGGCGRTSDRPRNRQCVHGDNTRRGDASVGGIPPNWTGGDYDNSALYRYNAAWDALRTVDNEALLDSGERLEIPWPTVDLKYTSLIDLYSYKSHHYNRNHHALPPEIMHDPFQLQKWNAFCFFVEAFGFRAYYAFEPVTGSPLSSTNYNGRKGYNPNDDRTILIFNIDVVSPPMSRQRGGLGALKAQMQKEKLRWHPDRWRLSMGGAAGMLADEKVDSAKAVWDAVVDISQACEIYLRGLGL
ncbi:hypothetical protein FQN54_001041 [Arachnomyces sp. PD_36]|nr:hypothetical protein FQN54_001041 [Arachnomyces sp. PD_36]